MNQSLTIEMCLKGKLKRDEYSPTVVMQVLKDAGYTMVGWANDGVVRPEAPDWREQYQNWSGSWTISVSDSKKLIYCTDMGD